MNDTANSFLWSDVLQLALSAGDGRLKHTGILAAGARGALIVDAVERDVITRDAGDLHFGQPPGSGMLDQLVAELEGHPQRTLAELLQRGRPHLSAFLADLVHHGVWQRHGLSPDADFAEYRDRDAARIEQLRSTVSDRASSSGDLNNPHLAALVAVAHVLNLQAGPAQPLGKPDESLLAACGKLRWIVEDVVTYLIDAQLTDVAAGQANGVSSTALLASD